MGTSGLSGEGLVGTSGLLLRGTLRGMGIRTEDKTDFVLGADPDLHDLVDLYELFFFVIAELTTSSQRTSGLLQTTVHHLPDCCRPPFRIVAYLVESDHHALDQPAAPAPAAYPVHIGFPLQLQRRSVADRRRDHVAIRQTLGDTSTDRLSPLTNTPSRIPTQSAPAHFSQLRDWNQIAYER